MSARIDAIVWLDPPILLDASLAGQSDSIRINKLRMKLSLPTEAADFDKPAPPAAIPAFPDPPLAEGFSKGSVITHVGPAHGDEVFVAGAIRLQFSDPTFAERFPKTPDYPFVEGIDAWLKTVRDWLYAWATRPGHDIRVPPMVRMRAALPDRPELGTSWGGGSHDVIVMGERAATPAEWRLALKKASANEGLPLPYALISEAILRRSLGEPRLAVITACSAAEVALSDAARAALKAAGRSGAESKEVLRGANGVADLYRLCSLLPNRPSVSFGRVLTKLAEPRNLAAHEGKDPEGTTVGEAILTAREIVRMTPLPRPEDEN